MLLAEHDPFCYSMLEYSSRLSMPADSIMHHGLSACNMHVSDPICGTYGWPQACVINYNTLNLCGQPLGYVMYYHKLSNHFVSGVQVQWLGRRGYGGAHH